jgi:integral membrane sensor domain MASE1
MTPDEIRLLAKALVNDTYFIWVLVIWLFINVLTAYFGSYLREKGKSSAIKEDIKDITRIIKSV